jgi:anti-sigma factor RsiW
VKFEGAAEIKPCPSSATLASFVDQRLSQAERNRVIAHLAECERCVAVVGAVVWAINQEGDSDGK